MGLFDFITNPIGSLIGSIAGDATSAASTAATNANNMAMNQQNINAAWDRQINAESTSENNALQAENFSAQQVQQQEQFQQGQVQQQEAYNTQMSDTAMQRRVTDLKAAGINPLLAISQGGASTPTISAMTGGAASGSMGSASPAGQGSSIPMQSPGAAFGNLGGQINSALQASNAQANIDLLKAQTDKTSKEADIEIPQQVEYLKSMTGLTDRNAEQAYYQTQNIMESIYNQRLTNDNLRDIVIPTGQVNLEVLKGTQAAIISASQSDATAKQLSLQGMRNLNDVEQSNVGKVLAYINALLAPVTSGAGAYGHIK